MSIDTRRLHKQHMLCCPCSTTAAVAQLVEPQIVALVVAGSSPVGRPQNLTTHKANPKNLTASHRFNTEHISKAKTDQIYQLIIEQPARLAVF